MGGKGGTQNKYYGNFAVVLGFGPNDVLWRIDDGDTPIWSGPIFRSTAMDGDGKTTLTVPGGQIDFYWGVPTQNVNERLASLKIDQGAGLTTVLMPAWRNLIVAVAIDYDFGNSESPPNLSFVMGRYPVRLAIPNGVSQIHVTDPGEGYVTPPTVDIAGGGGSGAQAVAGIKNGSVASVVVTNPGSGYTSVPGVTFSGGVAGQVGAIEAAGTPVRQNGSIVGVTITEPGTLYTSNPVVTFTGGGGSGAWGLGLVKNGKVVAIRMTDTGSGYTIDPIVGFERGRPRDATGTAIMSSAVHNLQGDSLIPEVIYDALTNPLYGAGMDSSGIIVQDFIDACTIVRAEGLGASPYFNEKQTPREIVGKLLSYVDGFLYLKNSKVGMKLLRPVTLAGTVQINEDDMTDELKPEKHGNSEVWSLTRVTFSDMANKGQQDNEPFDNPVVADALGQSVEKVFNYPFVTRRELAKQIAMRLGIKGGRPGFYYKTRLLPKHRARVLGEVVRLSSAKYDYVDVPARITEISYGSPGEPEVEVTLMVEMTRDTSHDYVPPQSTLVTPGMVSRHGTFTVEATEPRLMILPPGLLNGYRDGWLNAFGRVTGDESKAVAYFTYNPAQVAYFIQGRYVRFASKAWVVSWHPTLAGRWIVRLQLASDVDLEAWNGFVAASNDLYFCFGRRDVHLSGTPSDQHQVKGFWAVRVSGGYLRQVSESVFDIEVQGGQFEWEDFSLETVADPAQMPTDICYAGPLEVFGFVRSNVRYFERAGANGTLDVDLKRRAKVVLVTRGKFVALADNPEAFYDRDDTTMHPDGTYFPDWGPRSMTSSELVDRCMGAYFASTQAATFDALADLDEVLVRAFDGLTTDNDKRFFSSINATMGRYFLAGDGIYNLI